MTEYTGNVIMDTVLDNIANGKLKDMPTVSFEECIKVLKAIDKQIETLDRFKDILKKIEKQLEAENGKSPDKSEARNV